VVEKLGSRQMLKLFLIADIATEFWTVVDCMLLQLKKCFPNNTSILSVFEIAFMGELAEINTVSKDFINIL
jgi:hypothetical protein